MTAKPDLKMGSLADLPPARQCPPGSCAELKRWVPGGHYLV
ncbi:MAG TPA: hypothetical protein VFF10_06155 [Trueperaceae bacterium]|nr:hypothetical protein [Trueperaceae bacterium]